MIQKLEHRKTEVAEAMRGVFHASYAVEAKILGAMDFPPLRRTLAGYRESNNDFYGYIKDGFVNKPATDLYLKLGFRKTGEYDTDHGVRKVRFEKQV